MSAIRLLILILVAALGLSSCVPGKPRLLHVLKSEASSFVDPAGTLTIEEIDRRREELFQPDGSIATRLGPPRSRMTRFWLKIDGEALLRLAGPGSTEPMVLTLDDNRVREVRLFQVREKDVEEKTWKRFADLRESRRDGFRYPVFLIEPFELSGDRLYLSLAADGAVLGNVILTDFPGFASLYDDRTRLLTLVLGVRIALFAFILTLGLSLKSRTNLWLAALIGVGLLQIAADNTLFPTNAFPSSSGPLRALALGAIFGTHLCLVGFATCFLRLRRRAPWFFKLSRVLLILATVCTAAAIVDGLVDAGIMRGIVSYMRIVYLLFTLGAAIAVVRQSPSRAFAFLLAWTPAMAAVVLRTIQDLRPDWAGADIPSSASLAASTFSVATFAIISSLDVQRRESRLKAEVRHNSERFKAFAEIGTDVSWEVDEAGRISFVAGRSAPLPPLRLGDPFVDLVERATSPEAAAPLRAAIAGRLPFDDVRLRLTEAHDREAWISLSGRPIENQAYGGSVYRGLISDVSDEVERESRRMIEQQVFALGQLAGSVAHEINNLIHPIINLTKRLRARHRAASDTEGERMLDLIDLSSRQAAKVVSELLQTMRGDRNTDVDQPLPIALEQAIEAIRPALPLSVAVTLACEAGPWPSIRVGDMLQILGNLASNAVQAMSGPGTVRIVLSQAERGAKLTISDDGHGMEERVRLRALQPFFSTRSDGTGTGIGLYIVQRIVGDYKGRVSIDSVPGEGTSVTIFIPNRGNVDEG